VTYVESTIVTW